DDVMPGFVFIAAHDFCGGNELVFLGAEEAATKGRAFLVDLAQGDSLASLRGMHLDRHAHEPERDRTSPESRTVARVLRFFGLSCSSALSAGHEIISYRVHEEARAARRLFRSAVVSVSGSGRGLYRRFGAFFPRLFA